MFRTHIQNLVRSSTSATAFALALFGFSTTTSSAAAQDVQASYPLLTDLADSSGNYGPVTLTGGATGPTNGVCVNGVYALAGGQDVRTPNIGTLDADDFELEVEFQVAAFAGGNRPILIGGNGWRWIGFQVQSDGTFGILHNNAMSVWSTATVDAGTWYTGIIRYELGDVELWLDGTMVLQATIGVLDTGNDLDFTTNNYSNGTNHNGCIRNLVISNDTTLGGGGIPIGMNYCTAAANSTGQTGSISANGSDVATNNDVTLLASGLPTNQFGIFLTSMTQGFTPGAGGTSNGNICLGGMIGRYSLPNQILTTGSAGEFSMAIDLDQTPQGASFVSIMGGESWSFQAWHRDPVGVGSNFTNGLEISFQ